MFYEVGVRKHSLIQVPILSALLYLMLYNLAIIASSFDQNGQHCWSMCVAAAHATCLTLCNINSVHGHRPLSHMIPNTLPHLCVLNFEGRPAVYHVIRCVLMALTWSINHQIATRFCCALFCLFCIIWWVPCETMWYICQYPLRLFYRHGATGGLSTVWPWITRILEQLMTYKHKPNSFDAS